MSNIKLGSHVGMAGKEMFLASAKEAVSYGANVFMLYTGAPQNTRRKEISELNIEAGWKYAKEHGIEEIIVHAPYIINLANTIKPETYELAVEFLEKEIPLYTDACLAEKFFEEWSEFSKIKLQYGRCAGYKIPLFLGGADEKENLEDSDMEVYWEIITQVIKQL